MSQLIAPLIEKVAFPDPMHLTLKPDASSPPPKQLLPPEKAPVVMIAESIDANGGGAEIYMAHLLDFLAKSGHPVQVYVRRPYQDPVIDGVQVEVVPTMRRLRIVWEKRFARQIANRMRNHPRIVFSALPLPGITHYRPPSGLYRKNFEAIRESMHPGIGRSLYTMGNGLNLRRHLLVRMQEQLLCSAQPPKVMTLSHASGNQLQKLNPMLASNVVTLPPGVDLERFYPGREEINDWCPNRKPGELLLLFAGYNFRLKGLRPLLTAFRKALRQGLNAKLLVVGSPRGNNQLFPLLARFGGLSSHVRFLGSVPGADMVRLYRSCDALVHPTYFDHCSLVVFEALACGLPVVTTRQNGAAELMESGKQGFIIDHPNDIAALTAALLRLQDRDHLAKMSAAAIALRPQIDFVDHSRQVLAWLTSNQDAAS